jgi:drug/metabolite transporter (DMT)-like permease
MSLAALGLLLVAAVLHAGWNLIVKRAKQKQVFTWLALIIGALCFSPLLIISRPHPIQIWPNVAGSSLFEAIYFVGLTLAYDIDDFSLVYPLARGAAPALLVVWAALFLAERPRPGGLAGLTLLVLGLVIVGSAAWWSQSKITTPGFMGVAAALGTACCISIYTTIDGAAVRLVPSAPYTVVILGVGAALIAPPLLVRYRPAAIVAEWRVNWLRIILVGILMLVSYGLVLYVYTFARVSYAGSVREISIVFAAFIGWRWLGESFGSVRLVGAILIFAGILVIAIAG